jgi:EpsD family peptidyl-prolyl cis-trans isomerase
MNRQILCAFLLATALTGCQRKASGQTVAVVNNHEITAADLNAELASNAAAAGDPKAARAAALQRLVDRELLVQQAQSDGVDKSPEFLNQQLRLTDELLINMLVTRKMNTSQVPSADEISRYEASRPEMFANHEVWTLDQVLYPLPKDPALNAKLSAAKTLDEVIQTLTAAGVQMRRSTKKIDTAVFPHVIYEQIARLPAGEPFIAPGTDKAVASVITAHEASPISGDQASQLAVQAMKREKEQQVLVDRIKALRASAKIQYQPGFEPPKK